MLSIRLLLEVTVPDTASHIPDLEGQLSSFDPEERRAALLELKRLADEGLVRIGAPRPEVNLHFHTFYSFNAQGWSPSRIAWEARKYGLGVAGKVDFDVLEGMEEFLEAGDILGLKAVSGLETRVFIKEYADQVINSPGEPGVAYFMTAGCCRRPAEGSDAAKTLAGFFQTARSRNEELMGRVNAFLQNVQLDYARDVLPLTPAGNATERHLLLAYDRKARQVFPDEGELASFWAQKLSLSPSDAKDLILDPVKLQETIRGKLMKKGGVAYMQPESGSFPALEEVISFAKETGALPCAAWLDGTTPGEDNMDAMLGLLEDKGVVAANIIPERNWHIKDPEQKALKLRKLEEMVHAARDHAMPLCVGTEMNKLGLPFVDNFSAPELQPYVQDFVDGARFFWGHTLLSRWGDYGYFSPRVEAAFDGVRRRKNEFFQLVGRLPMPPVEKLKRLRDLDLGPERLLIWLQES